MERLLCNVSLLVSVMLSFFECAMDYRYPVEIYNNSSQDIICNICTGYPEESLFPDTTLSEFFEYKVYAKKSRSIGSSVKWSDKYEYLQTDTLCMFLLSADTLEKYGWEKVSKEYMILQRYDLSLEDLRLHDYKFYYPPTVKMKDIKMFPPYKRE